MQPVRTDRARNSGYAAQPRKRSSERSFRAKARAENGRAGVRALRKLAATARPQPTVEDHAAALARARRSGEAVGRALEHGHDLVPYFERRPGVFCNPGRCRVCGCTDDNACRGGCAWADDTHTLCTRCAPGGRAVERLEPPHLRVRVPFDELLDPADSLGLVLIRGGPVRLPADLVERFVAYCSRELLEMPIDSAARPMFELFLRALRDLAHREADRLVREAARAWFSRAGVEVRT
jgi:hypothetical protein